MLCPCLILEPGPSRGHSKNCPLNNKDLKTPLDMAHYLQDPNLYTPRFKVNLVSKKNQFDIRSQVVATRDKGLDRIDRYMQIINYIRRNIQGCTTFYIVTNQLLKHMFAQLLPAIVGDTLFNSHPHIYYNYSQLPPVPVRSFITTARQIGKTTTMAIAMTALLCVVDGQVDFCRIYARTQNQAVNLLTEIKSIFFRLPANLRPQTVLKLNETVLSVVSDYNSMPVVMSASPGNIEGIRGHKPRVIVVDEYQFTLPEFWTQHIWALTQVTFRTLICASTPGEPGSYMAAETQKMAAMPLLYPESRVLDFSLVCSVCRSNDTPLQCREKLNFLPPWKNVAGIRQAMSQFGDCNTMDLLQEVFGEPMSSGTRIFDPKLIAEVFQSPCASLNSIAQGNVIFVAIDPSGGGESEMAICSMLYMEDSRLLILGLDSALTKKLGAADMAQFVRVHLRRLRRYTFTARAILIPIVEDQGGVPLAETLCRVFTEEEFQPAMVTLLGHDVANKCHSSGVQTTKPIKENMVFLIQECLANRRLLLWDRLITTGSRNCQLISGNTPPIELIKILASQLTNLYYDERKHITGKIGNGFKDDLAMAFMLAVYWSNKLRLGNRVLVSGQLSYNPRY